MTATDYLEGKVLDHVLNVNTYTRPTALYLCLHTADPTETGLVAQVTGGSYAPQLITFGAFTYDAVNGTRSFSTNSQTFLSMPAVTVTHFAIREISTTGTPIVVGQLTITRTIVVGDPIVFGAGQIIVTAD